MVEAWMWNIVLLEEVDAWFLDLVRTEDPVAEHVAAAIELLARTGPSLGRPAVDSIKRSTVHNLKPVGRFCSSRGTRRGDGMSGTGRPSRWLSTDMSSGSSVSTTRRCDRWLVHGTK
ncbi:hypothetical protein [Promicromonospora sp. NPDC059942]|uniref:hypothetical protein n=1 Tax=Promicromonospora sp. NPDC059942 TaxID=3347009 RepID=UPI003663B1A9